MLAKALIAAAGSGVATTQYVDDLFVSYVRTGTGAEQTVTTNIDMTEGYLVWSKGRSGATDHALYDSARGVTKDLVSNSTAAETTQAQGLKSVTSSSHTWGTLAKVNTSTATYVDWVFRKAPKFFDVVTYTGNGTTQNISHALGQEVGMVIVKQTTAASTTDWAVYHRANTANPETDYLLLNTTAATADDATYWNDTAPTTTQFTVGSNAAVNANLGTYVAYVFAHDTATDGLIQCGTLNNAGSDVSVSLGWEPQFILLKRSSGGTASWFMLDVSRGIPTGVGDPFIFANLSNAEVVDSLNYVDVSATGFTFKGAIFGTGDYIYLAIRRPNKPPTTGTQVYNAIARTGTGAAATVTGVGFAPDLALIDFRTDPRGKFFDRLRGGMQELQSASTAAESTRTTALVFNMDGYSTTDDGSIDINDNGGTFINWLFKRAPGVFDVVCYTGTGVARTVDHNLGAVPEMMIVKNRSDATGRAWAVYYGDNTDYLVLNTTAATVDDNTYWNDTSPTASVFTVGTANSTNESADTLVAYLFATKNGISKIGTYTGNGTSQTINCGFTTGARFFLVKATSTTGSWWVYDSVRGIISGNDPALQLNSTAAEVTTADACDPDNSGIIVNEEATCAINTNLVSYVYLALA